MKKSMVKHVTNQRGVTLIELLAVIVILGILAAIAVPAVLGQINQAETQADATTVKIIQDAADRYYVLDGSENPVSIQTLVDEEYLKETPAGYDGADTVAQDGTITDN